MADDEKDAPAEDAAPVAVYISFRHAILVGFGMSVGAAACALLLWTIYMVMSLVSLVVYRLGAVWGAAG